MVDLPVVDVRHDLPLAAISAMFVERDSRSSRVRIEVARSDPPGFVFGVELGRDDFVRAILVDDGGWSSKCRVTFNRDSRITEYRR
jgi:hypothetical protein